MPLNDPTSLAVPARPHGAQVHGLLELILTLFVDPALGVADAKRRAMGAGVFVGRGCVHGCVLMSE